MQLYLFNDCCGFFFHFMSVVNEGCENKILGLIYLALNQEKVCIYRKEKQY
jgi:hypothetical protein